MDVEILDTADGSHTLRNKTLNVTYHSTNGALQESIHVYIEAGFRYALERFKKIHVLEIGFGTGLNALLTYNESVKTGIDVDYQTIEKFPIAAEIVNSLNYAAYDPHNVFEKLHASDWNTAHRISDFFGFTKNLIDVNDFKISTDVHLVYFDAFAPDSTSEMWHKDIFERIYEVMIPGGCLVTFCAKGNIKRMLKTCGFKVEALPGYAGKREMTRAIKM